MSTLSEVKMRSDQLEHRRKSIRLKDFDYSQTGAYFVTICTEERKPFFEYEHMKKIARDCWLKIPGHSPNVQLDEWVIMPNHLHGIIVINPAEDVMAEVHYENVGARYIEPLQKSLQKPLKRITLGSIVRTYKAAVTRNY